MHSTNKSTGSSFSEYLYLDMQAWFAEQNLDGFANWLMVQTKEEHAHAMGFYYYLLDREFAARVYTAPVINGIIIP